MDRFAKSLVLAACFVTLYSSVSSGEDITMKADAAGFSKRVPPPNAAAPFYPVVAGGVSQWAPSFTNGLMQPRLLIDGAAAVRMGTVELDLGQTVETDARAGANLNLYLVTDILGQIDKDAMGSVSFDYRAQLIRVPGGAVVLDDNPAAITAAGAVDRFNVLSALNVADGNFGVVQFSDLVADTAAGTAGMSNNIDFNTQLNAGTTTEQNRGMIARLIASPTGLANSRDVIGVAAARANPKLKIGGQSVTGKDVNLGQIELGRPHTTHKDLPGAALVVDAMGNDAFYQDEHALAVAGLIVGRSANLAEQGVAPGARLYSSAFTAYPGNTNEKILGSMKWMLEEPAASVINGSFSVPDLVSIDENDGDSQMARLYDWVVAKKRTMMVLSAGNSGGNAAPDPGEEGFQNAGINNVTNSIGGNNGGYNGITVGALDWDFKSRAYFSSFGPTDHPVGMPRTKPDIVAPGTFMLTTVAADLDGANGLDDYERYFFGVDDFNRPANRRYGGAEIHGTSFAAPMVTGAMGLMLEFARAKDGSSTKDRTDPRVMKAAVMNTADRTNVKHRTGENWTQGVDLSGTFPVITQPLDSELGAGLIKIDKAMLQINPKEAREADNVPAVNKWTLIDAAPLQWDIQDVARSGAVGSLNQGRIVGYKFDRGLVKGQKVKATVVWNRDVTSADGDLDVETTDTFNAAAVSNLDLRLYRERPLNDPERKTIGVYQLLLKSASMHDNVELIQTTIGRNGTYWLDVRTETDKVDQFAIVWDVGSNPAATGGIKRVTSVTPPDDGDVTALLSESLDVEAAADVMIKPTFMLPELESGEDVLLVLDDNEGFSYSPGERYPIYFGRELREDPLDPNSDVDWFDESTSISLGSLEFSDDWRQLVSASADGDGNLPPTLIGDTEFLSSLVFDGADALEFNFVVDVDRDGFFTPDIDGVGWFEVVVPEPSGAVLALVATIALSTIRRRRPQKC